MKQRVHTELCLRGTVKLRQLVPGWQAGIQKGLCEIPVGAGASQSRPPAQAPPTALLQSVTRRLVQSERANSQHHQSKTFDYNTARHLLPQTCSPVL